MSRAENIIAERRMPNAAWAWEGLRRNSDYRRHYRAANPSRLKSIRLATGAQLIRPRRRFIDAEDWGLLVFADPAKPAIEANVFWQPDLLAGCLNVRLSPLTKQELALPDDHHIITLSALRTRRVLLETVDGARHILLNGRRFWIQLYCEKPALVGEQAHIGIRLNHTPNMGRRLDTAAQLLSLHRANGGKLSLIGRRKNAAPISNALTAFDIWTGFECEKGGLKEIAIALAGEARVKEDWGGSSRYLKDMAARARDKGLAFVAGDYRKFLNKKSI